MYLRFLVIKIGVVCEVYFCIQCACTAAAVPLQCMKGTQEKCQVCNFYGKRARPVSEMSQLLCLYKLLGIRVTYFVLL